METKSAIVGGLSALFAVGIALSGCTASNTEAQPANTPVTTTATNPAPEPTTPCAEEDSPGPCYWDANKMGNGVGRSFYVDANQVVHYKD